MTNMVCVCDRTVLELGTYFRCFAQYKYKLVSFIRVESVMSGFCK